VQTSGVAANYPIQNILLRFFRTSGVEAYFDNQLLAAGASMQNSVPMQHLVIITTGGTIDKIYFDDLSNFQIGEPQIGKILEAIGAGFSFEVIALMRKDSLHITDSDRDLIRATIAAQGASHILVTHGTDTMVATAQRLMDIPGKTIVITGALNPARFQGSDAVFNIGVAVAAVQCKKPGVYVAMNGQIWDPTKVRKNRAANRFEPTP
jgi:L-asparaginase